MFPRPNVPAGYTDEGHYTAHFNQLSIDNKQKAADDTKTLLAQRLLALHFEEIGNKQLSRFWWEQAARAKDSIAIMRQGAWERVQSDILKAQNFCQTALTSATSKYGKDPVFLTHLQNVIQRIFFDAGMKKYHAGDIQGAGALFAIGMEFDDPSAAFNLAAIAFKNKNNLEHAIHYLQMALFLSGQCKSPEKIRAKAHHMLGMIKAKLLKNDDSFDKNALEVMCHFQKAISYCPENKTYSEWKSKFLLLVPEDKRVEVEEKSLPLPALQRQLSSYPDPRCEIISIADDEEEKTSGVVPFARSRSTLLAKKDGVESMTSTTDSLYQIVCRTS